MKHIIITTIAAGLLVGCGESQQSSPPEAQPAEPASEAPVQLSSPPQEAKPVEPTEPVEPVEPVEPIAKAAQPAQDADAAKQVANRALMTAVRDGNIEAIKQQLAAGADVNAKDDDGLTPMDRFGDEETASLLRKHGGKTRNELKAEGK
jgi:PBP1b-binding outer membrane lipoprotein LpoB